MTAAVIMMSGLTACGDMNNNQNTEGEGYSYQGNRLDGNGSGSSYRQQGGSANSYGQRGLVGHRSEGYGNNQQHHTKGFTRGVVGNDRAGMVDENGLLNGRMRAHDRAADRQGLNHGVRGSNFAGSQANRNNMQTEGYYDSDEGRAARKLEARVDEVAGVQDCDVLINDDQVVIGVRGDDTDGDVEQKVRSLANDMVDDKQIHVVTDESAADEIHQMEGRLRDGAAFEEIGETFNAMMNDLGNAMQRPFERTR